MSQHAGQKGPTSGRGNIRGSGATYRASVQKASRTQAAETRAGDGVIKRADKEGKGSAPKANDQMVSMPGGYGSGHYVANS